MAKVYGLHMIALRPGVKAEDFERFAEGLPGVTAFEGWQIHLLKGLRGDRAGRYLLMYEIESVEALNRYVPTLLPEGRTEEAKRCLEAFAAEWGETLEKWDSFVTPEGIIFTDYVVIGE